jgi:hypothetical protein
VLIKSTAKGGEKRKKGDRNVAGTKVSALTAFNFLIRTILERRKAG